MMAYLDRQGDNTFWHTHFPSHRYVYSISYCKAFMSNNRSAIGISDGRGIFFFIHPLLDHSFLQILTQVKGG